MDQIHAFYLFFHLFPLSFPLYLVHYSTNLPNEVVETLKGQAKYVTLGRTKEQYFVKLGEGRWIGDLDEGAMKGYNEIHATVGANFDAALTGMVFGKVGRFPFYTYKHCNFTLVGQGDTMLFSFQGGFMGYTDTKAEGSNLEKVNILSNRRTSSSLKMIKTALDRIRQR